MGIEIAYSIDEAVVAVDDGSLDGDDRVHDSSLSGNEQVRLAGEAFIARQLADSAGVKQRIVPFVRDLHAGSVGRDVRAVKRALRHADPGLIGNTTMLYGPGAARAVRRFQERNHLAVDGVYGKRTHAKLAAHFDAYGVWLLMHTKVVRSAGPRGEIVAAALAVYDWHQHGGGMHYTQGPSRMTIVRHHYRPPFNRTLWEDCSSAATGIYWIARQPDPNWLGYNGEGWTGSLSEHGRRVDAPLPGDLIFYGWGHPWKHVTVAVGDHVDRPATRAFSFGHEGGPDIVSPHYRGDYGQARSYVPG